jgi:hypothetical protein
MVYSISQADLTRDRAAILGLWRRNFPGSPEHRFAWLYESGQASAWLLHDEDGVVVGAAGLMPRAIRMPGGLIHAGQAIDLNVDPNHRLLGPAISLARAVVEGAGQRGYRLVYTFPNPKSAPVLRRAGYRELAGVQRWVKVLRTDAVLDRLEHPLTRMAVAAASGAINAALAVKSREALCRRPANVQTRVTNAFDESFDRFWQAASQPADLMAERNASYLNWRFGRQPASGFQVFRLENACGELLAYAVFSCQDGAAFVSDWGFADRRSLEILLAEFVRFTRRQKVKLLVTVYVGNALVPSALRRFGFWRRESDWKAMVYAEPERRGSNVPDPLCPDRWYLTRADIDTDF